ncbi:TSUP family transporter [Lacrimispora brassicae]
MRYPGFFLTILLSNIIQGITGFAGTILAMPPSLMLVGYNTAKPVLNVLGLLSGVYVFAGHRKSVCWRELKKVVAVMAAGILGGIFLKGFFVGQEQQLYRMLGVFVIALSEQGLIKLKGGEKGLKRKKAEEAGSTEGLEMIENGPVMKNLHQAKDGQETKTSPALYLLLVLAGIVHGIFVSGGPLLIGYMTKRLKDKESFRATVSTVWVVLNTIILLDDIRMKLWNPGLVRILAMSLPFLLAGMFMGNRLYVKMSQRLFMMITYALLFISGISLLVK